MSEAELHLIRTRMDQGKRNKARRGELFCRLPAGYVFLDSGEVAFDPDQQAQSVLRLVFDKFSELGSGRAVAGYLRRHQIRLPLRPENGPKRPPLQWREPSAAAIHGILNHPIYAGAYVYGRQPVDHERKQSGSSRPGRRTVTMDEWEVLLRDRLPAYITWDQYLANRERLRQNSSRWDTQGVPRQGEALLGGLVYCSHCGHRMQVHYPEAHRGLYVCLRRDGHESRRRCPHVPVPGVDALVSREVLRALEPAALELSLQAHEDLERERQRLHKHWQQELERAGYLADRARRQYEAAEPENRLVGRELEGQWEKALRHQRRLEEDYARFQLDLPAALSRSEREAIRSLAHDLPQLWQAETTTPADRQVVIRNLVQRVQVRVEGAGEEVVVAVHWKGGFVSRHQFIRPIRRYRELKDYDKLMKRIRELRESGERAPGVATRLNAEGFRAPKGGSFTAQTAQTVRTLLSRQGLSRARAAREHPAVCGEDEWWAGDLARELDVSPNGVKGWIERATAAGTGSSGRMRTSWDACGGSATSARRRSPRN